MSLTNPAVHVPADETIGSWLRSHLGWMLIGLAVIAAAVLVTFLVLDGESASTTVPEPGITATDQPGSADIVRPHAGWESPTAVDHRTAAG